MGPAVPWRVGAVLIPAALCAGAQPAEEAALATRSSQCVPDRWLAGLGPAHVRELPASNFWGGASGSYCGVYCLYLAAQLKGFRPPSPANLAIISAAEGGITSISGLRAAARAIGFLSAEPSRIRPEDLRTIPYPVVAYRRDPAGRLGHFLLLAQLRDGMIQVVDYPRYVAWIPFGRLEQFDERWQGEAVLLKGLDGALLTPVRSAVLGGGLACIAAGSWLLGRRLIRKHARRDGAASEAKEVPATGAAVVGR